MERVKTVIDACIANGVYAIIDWHSMKGAQNDIPSAQAFFSTVARAYGKTPNIMYEPWNEPEQESWPVIKAYHEAIIATLRPIDPDNIISEDPITCTSNIAYSIHYYAATHKQWLRDDGAIALKNGVALFATEYGTTRADGNGMCDLAESQRWWDWLDANNVGCANWSVADMTETSAAFQPGTSACSESTITARRINVPPFGVAAGSSPRHRFPATRTRWLLQTPAPVSGSFP